LKTKGQIQDTGNVTRYEKVPVKSWNFEILKLGMNTGGVEFRMLMEG